MIANFVELLPVLNRHQVQFILIGGGAGIVYGSQRVTTDVDVVYSRRSDNLARLAELQALLDERLK